MPILILVEIKPLLESGRRCRHLQNLLTRTLSIAESGLLASEFHADWRSPCELHQDSDLTYWKPVRQEVAVSFEGLANALELEIHPDIQAYYASYWSGTLEADSAEGRVSLIQLWNDEDFDRLIANLIGHAMAKQKSRQGFTVFYREHGPGHTDVSLNRQRVGRDTAGRTRQTSPAPG